MNALALLLVLGVQAPGDPPEAPEPPPEEVPEVEERPPEAEPEPEPKPKPKPKPKPAEPKPEDPGPAAAPKPAVPKPAPALKPAPAPPVSPRPAPVAPAPREVAAHQPLVDKLTRELQSITERTGAAEMERICTQWLPRGFAEQRPLVAARLAVCSVAAAEKAGREAVVAERLKAAFDAVRAAGPGLLTRELDAELRLLDAELRARQLLSMSRCSVQLGLPTLRRMEGERLQRDLATVVSAFEAVIATREPAAARRALFGIAAVYDQLDVELRTQLPSSYRMVAVDDPFLWSRIDPQAILSLTALVDPAWAGEVSRVLAALLEDPGTDAALKRRVTEARAAIDKRAPVFTAPIESPFGRPPEGAISYRTDGFVQLTRGRWRPLTAVDAQAALAATRAAGMDKPSWPWAIVASARGGSKLNPIEVTAGLASPKLSVRVATLVALTHEPTATSFKPLVDHWASRPGKREPFSTLKAAVFGEREWTLRALQSVVTRERGLALQLMHQNKLPVSERLWLVAELGDPKLYQRFPEMARGDERSQALAIFAAFRSGGERMAWMARAGASGLVGCVSDAVNDELSDRRTRALEAAAAQP